MNCANVFGLMPAYVLKILPMLRALYPVKSSSS